MDIASVTIFSGYGPGCGRNGKNNTQTTRISCLDILKWKAFLIKPTVCSILMIDVTIDERN